jgi:predicted amidohydrolase
VLKEYPKSTAAAVQAAPEYRERPVCLDSQATLSNAVARVKEAAANGATLVVFPERRTIPGPTPFAANREVDNAVL